MNVDGISLDCCISVEVPLLVTVLWRFYAEVISLWLFSFEFSRIKTGISVVFLLNDHTTTAAEVRVLTSS